MGSYNYLKPLCQQNTRVPERIDEIRNCAAGVRDEIGWGFMHPAPALIRPMMRRADEYSAYANI